MSQPVCWECGQPATCLGKYEAMTGWYYACDSCCGHGCEDGKCYPLDEIPTGVLIEFELQTTGKANGLPNHQTS